MAPRAAGGARQCVRGRRYACRAVKGFEGAGRVTGARFARVCLFCGALRISYVWTAPRACA